MRRFAALTIISIVLLLAGIAACSSGGGSDETVQNSPDPGTQNVAAADAVDENVSSDTATSKISATETEAVIEPETELETEIQGLYLEVTSPSNESVVKTSSVRVTGNTIPAAIVSVNGVLTSVNSEGSFAADTTLEVGANFIEIVTSDLEGKEIGEVVTIVYLPT